MSERPTKEPIYSHNNNNNKSEVLLGAILHTPDASQLSELLDMGLKTNLLIFYNYYN